MAVEMLMLRNSQI